MNLIAETYYYFRKIIPKPHYEESPSTHQRIGKYPCNNCEKVFPQAYRLRRHVKEVHDKVKAHECEHCNKKFFKFNSLHRHRVSVHDKLRPYSCTNCDSKFKDKTALNYHSRKNVCFTKTKHIKS